MNKLMNNYMLAFCGLHSDAIRRCLEISADLWREPKLFLNHFLILYILADQVGVSDGFVRLRLWLRLDEGLMFCRCRFLVLSVLFGQ